MRTRHGEAAALGVALGARRGTDGVGRLLLQQEPADLRPVPVGEDDLPAHRRDVGDALGRGA